MHTVLAFQHVQRSPLLLKPFEQTLVIFMLLTNFAEDGSWELVVVTYQDEPPTAVLERNQGRDLHSLGCLIDYDRIEDLLTHLEYVRPCRGERSEHNLRLREDGLSNLPKIIVFELLLEHSLLHQTLKRNVVQGRIIIVSDTDYHLGLLLSELIQQSFVKDLLDDFIY